MISILFLVSKRSQLQCNVYIVQGTGAAVVNARASKGNLDDPKLGYSGSWPHPSR